MGPHGWRPTPALMAAAAPRRAPQPSPSTRHWRCTCALYRGLQLPAAAAAWQIQGLPHTSDWTWQHSRAAGWWFQGLPYQQHSRAVAGHVAGHTPVMTRQHCTGSADGLTRSCGGAHVWWHASGCSCTCSQQLSCLFHAVRLTGAAGTGQPGTCKTNEQCAMLG